MSFFRKIMRKRQLGSPIGQSIPRISWLMLKSQCIVLIIFWIINPLLKDETFYALNCQAFILCCMNSHILNLKESCLKTISCLHLKRNLLLCLPTDGMNWTVISTAALSLPFNSENIYLWGQNSSSQEAKQEKNCQEDPCFSFAGFIALVRPRMVKMLGSLQKWLVRDGNE